jgi:hypothetical protein
MKKWARWEPPGVPGFFSGGRDKIDRNPVRHPSNIVRLRPDVELQAVGMMKFTCATEPAPPPPPGLQGELAAAIAVGTTLEELKAALLGRSRAGKVAGRPT